MFDLRFMPEENFSKRRNEKVALGKICFGNFNEYFEASLSFWKAENYRQQWIEAAKKIFEFDRTAFITNLSNPETANFIVWWIAWKSGETIFIQNHLLFLNKLSEPFDLKNPYKFINSREIETEEGEKISEWKISLSDIIKFLNDNE